MATVYLVTFEHSTDAQEVSNFSNTLYAYMLENVYVVEKEKPKHEIIVLNGKFVIYVNIPGRVNQGFEQRCRFTAHGFYHGYYTALNNLLK